MRQRLRLMQLILQREYRARDIDDKMADARRVLDWDAQFACALDPETAKAIRDDRLPEDDHSEACRCAVSSVQCEA